MLTLNSDEASDPPEKLSSKPPMNSFSVPEDDDVIEIDRSSGYKLVATFTVPDSDDDSGSDSVPPQEQPTPATSPLSKDATNGRTGEDAEASSQKLAQLNPAADAADLDEGSRSMPVIVDEDQALVTPTTTPPPAADSPSSCILDDNDWISEEIDSGEDDSASQWSQELEGEEDADASCSSGESSEEGFADNGLEAPNKSFTPPPPTYAGVSFMPCINEWAGPSTTNHAAQLPLGPFPSAALANASNPYSCYSDGPFMLSHARPSAENVGPTDSITLPGPDTLVGRHDNRFMDEQRWKGLPGCNNFGKPVLPSFTHLPFLTQPTSQNGNIINDERATLGQENGIERRAAESTATTRVSIADIVHESKPETESRASLKRKAAEMELESIDSVPSYFDEFSDLPHCGESMKEAQLESVFSDVASLPDAQPQSSVNDLDSASSELTKIPTVCHAERSKKNEASEDGPLRKRAKLTHIYSRRSNFTRDAVLALGGVVVGSILTVAGLASLPPDFFTA